jgi:hypothetical protein
MEAGFFGGFEIATAIGFCGFYLCEVGCSYVEKVIDLACLSIGMLYILDFSFNIGVLF